MVGWIITLFCWSKIRKFDKTGYVVKVGLRNLINFIFINDRKFNAVFGNIDIYS